MINKLKKLYDWLPIIWKDEDWDYAYLLTLIRFKLTRMRRLIETNGHHAHDLDIVKQMLEAEIMLRNIDEDPDDEWSAHYDQWHNSDSLFGTDCDAPEECQKSLVLTTLREENNWKALWTHFDKYMRRWWD